MALVRCSCLVELLAGVDARSEFSVSVTVLDPGCGYVVHRLGADLLTAGEPDSQSG